jgi:hypothetical protein
MYWSSSGAAGVGVEPALVFAESVDSGAEVVPSVAGADEGGVVCRGDEGVGEGCDGECVEIGVDVGSESG